EGKTTLAVELARWLVQTRRFERTAFISLEEYTDARGVLMKLGQQLLPEGENWHVADSAEDFKQGRQAVERALRDRRPIIGLVSQVMKREGLEPKHDDAGNTPREVAELVEAVGCHARALTLLAREIAIQGVSATTGNVQRLMEELERKHPGKRENSLYASVELSLRRLPPEMRQQIKALGVF